jgi:hypothetical protein
VFAIDSLLPLAALVLVETAFVKFAVGFLLRWKSSWASAFMFGAAVVAAHAAGVGLLRAFDLYLPIALGILMSIALQIGFGGWILGALATTTAGEPLGFRRGALVSLIAYGFMVVLGTLAWALLAALVPQP